MPSRVRGWSGRNLTGRFSFLFYKYMYYVLGCVGPRHGPPGIFCGYAPDNHVGIRDDCNLIYSLHFKLLVILIFLGA
jgi:hypothetical protein